MSLLVLTREKMLRGWSKISMGFLKLFKAIIYGNLHIYIQEIIWFQNNDLNNNLDLSTITNGTITQDMIVGTDSSKFGIKVWIWK